MLQSTATTNVRFLLLSRITMSNEPRPCPGDVCPHIYDVHNFYDCARCLLPDIWMFCTECDDAEACNECECGGLPLIPPESSNQTHMKYPFAPQHDYKNLKGRTGTQPEREQTKNVEKQVGRGQSRTCTSQKMDCCKRATV